jgi:hypothetical protein
MLLSATLAPYWRGTRLRSGLLAAATLIDPMVRIMAVGMLGAWLTTLALHL